MSNDDDFDQPRRKKWDDRIESRGRRRDDDDDYYDERNDYDDRSQHRPDPHQRVRGPGMALFVIGLICAVLCLMFIGLFVALLFIEPPAPQEEAEAFFVVGLVSAFGLFGVVLCGLIALGGKRMSQCRSYGLAMTAAILAIASTSLILLPFGIWAVVVLCDKDVKRAFARSTEARDYDEDR